MDSVAQWTQKKTQNMNNPTSTTKMDAHKHHGTRWAGAAESHYGYSRSRKRANRRQRPKRTRGPQRRHRKLIDLVERNQWKTKVNKVFRGFLYLFHSCVSLVKGVYHKLHVPVNFVVATVIFILDGILYVLFFIGRLLLDILSERFSQSYRALQQDERERNTGQRSAEQADSGPTITDAYNKLCELYKETIHRVQQGADGESPATTSPKNSVSEKRSSTHRVSSGASDLDHEDHEGSDDDAPHEDNADQDLHEYDDREDHEQDGSH